MSSLERFKIEGTTEGRTIEGFDTFGRRKLGTVLSRIFKIIIYFSFSDKSSSKLSPSESELSSSSYNLFFLVYFWISFLRLPKSMQEALLLSFLIERTRVFLFSLGFLKILIFAWLASKY